MRIKPNTIYKSCLLALATPFIVGCDGGSSEDELEEQFPDVINRGLNISEITNNPAGTPGFPTVLEEGETISFIPLENLFFTEFLEEVPLGTWSVNSSGLLSQGSATSGDIFFPLGEDTFSYNYSTPGVLDINNPTATSQVATIQYTDEFEFTDIEFDRRLSQVANSPGSALGQALTDNAEDDFFDFDFINNFDIGDASGVTAIQKIYIDAISSVSIASVSNSVFGLQSEDDSVYTRYARDITLFNITSTNADLIGNNPTIEGTYRIEERWEETSNINGRLSQFFGSRFILRGIQEGTFVLRLNQLDLLP